MGRHEQHGGLYSSSEWWLERHTPGPGSHSHPEDVFYVIEETISFLIGNSWVDAGHGALPVAAHHGDRILRRRGVAKRAELDVDRVR